VEEKDMWIREELKQRAKNVLRKYYWIAFLVTLVASILGGIQGGGAPSITNRFNNNDVRLFNLGDWHWNWNLNDVNFSSPDVFHSIFAVLFGSLIFSAIFLIALGVGYAVRIFLGGPVEIGMDHYFLEARQDKSDFVNLFYSFKNGRYMNIVKAIAWRELFIFLWSLLFVIPGWIKGYSYSMIPYIMADNPTMDYKRAMTLSVAMTSGEKWNIFVLDLSFIGWFLLGLLVCCVGEFFVTPYFQATKAELYVVLRQKALDKGLCSVDEVGQQAQVTVQ
jgi:uncharacterized membrane protein